MGKQNRTGQYLIICRGFSITRRAARAIWKRGNKAWGRNHIWQWKVWTHCEFQRHHGDLSVKGETECVRGEKCEFLARESVSSSPIVRIFGKGKCKFIANFSATMVTSLPSISLSLSVSLSLSHQKYLTHNIYPLSYSQPQPFIIRRHAIYLVPLRRWSEPRFLFSGELFLHWISWHFPFNKFVMREVA